MVVVNHGMDEGRLISPESCVSFEYILCKFCVGLVLVLCKFCVGFVLVLYNPVPK